jgi:hypothetical protein
MRAQRVPLSSYARSHLEVAPRTGYSITRYYYRVPLVYVVEPDGFICAMSSPAFFPSLYGVHSSPGRYMLVFLIVASPGGACQLVHSALNNGGCFSTPSQSWRVAARRSISVRVEGQRCVIAAACSRDPLPSMVDSISRHCSQASRSTVSQRDRLPDPDQERVSVLTHSTEHRVFAHAHRPARLWGQQMVTCSEC